MEAVSVSQLNSYIKGLLEEDLQLEQIPVRGEISNYTAHGSGHQYFTLKDRDASLRCVMFRREAARLQFHPKPGMAVIALGRISVYEAGGQYQLYVQYLEPDGLGGQYLALEELKQKLAALGYLAEDRKRPLPAFPTCVGVITSPTGAAWQDIQKVAGSRFAGVKLKLFPAVVQGADAPASLVAALAAANQDPAPDVLIVGRGGGSAEDLWCFNNEEVAMAIVRSRLPVVSAVGHEIDITLADLVADLRAATPSAAAELVVPDRVSLERQLSQVQQRLILAVTRGIDQGKVLVDNLAKKPVFTAPQMLLEKNWHQLEEWQRRLQQTANEGSLAQGHQLTNLGARLSLLNPAATLNRGYALCYHQAGILLTDAAQVSPGEEITAKLSKGQLRCCVLAVERTEKEW